MTYVKDDETNENTVKTGPESDSNQSFKDLKGVISPLSHYDLSLYFEK